VIIHCATKDEQTTIKKSEKKEVFETNIKMTKNIQKFANNNKVKKIIFLSTVMVKNNSRKKIISEKNINRKDLYSMSKLLSEKILCNKENYFKTTCLRLPGVLGTRIPEISTKSFLKAGILTKIIALMKINKDIKIFNAYKKFNNVTDVKEIFNFINKNLKKINKNIIVQIAAANPLEFIKVVNILKAGLKSSSNILIIDKKINSFTFSAQKIRKTFGFIPSSTEKILKRACKEIGSQKI